MTPIRTEDHDPWWSSPLWVGLVGALLYLQTLAFGLVNYDDPWLIEGRLALLDQPISQLLSQIWLDLSPEVRLQLGAEYLPVRDLSVLLDHLVFGAWHGGYHLTNILLYGLLCALTARVIQRWTGRKDLAWIAGLLFAVHPLHVESVAWLSERKGLLAGLFIMAAALVFRRFVVKPSGWRWLSTVALLVLAIWSKAVGLTGVALLLALVWFFPEIWRPQLRLDGLGSASSPRRRGRIRTIWISWAALAVVCLLAFYPVWKVGKTLVVERQYHGGGLLSTAWLSAKALALYLKHFFLGGELGISYPVEQQSGWIGLLGALAAVALLALAIVGAWRRGSWSILGLAAVGWWVFFLPVSQLLAPLQNVAADRYMLLPLLPLSLLLAELLARLSMPRLRLVLVLLVLVLAAGKTVLQTQTWASSRALYRQALRADPGRTETMVQLARIAASEGKLDSAWTWLSRASRIQPENSQVRMHQALLLYRTGRRAAAIQQLRSAAAQDPDADKVRANLALLLARDGPSKEALEWARQAAKIRPLSLHNQRTLGVVALKSNRHNEAELALGKALRLRPQDVQALYNMGLLQLRRGRKQLALRYLLRALKRNPGHRAARHLVGEIRGS